MLEKGKVSMVVPIYKVEKYIHRCINSIVNQTYSNLEIILVDDGSPDNCGNIADAYQETDNRIKVIHKENGGLSDARNYGMKQVTGEYTMFVDSDDWLEKKMVESMIQHSLKHKADVVQSAFYYAYDDKLLVDNRYFNTGDSPVLLNTKELMYELVVNEKVKNFAWGKLYKTELIQDIPFKKGVLFEDVFWAHQVMHRAKVALLLQQPFYYYFQRNDSIVATYTTRNLDIIRGMKERHLFLETYYKELINESYKAILKMSMIHYNLLALNRKEDKGAAHREEIKRYIQDNYSRLKDAVHHDKQLHMELLLFSLHPVVNIIFLGVRKGLRRMGILKMPSGLDKVERHKKGIFLNETG